MLFLDGNWFTAKNLGDNQFRAKKFDSRKSYLFMFAMANSAIEFCLGENEKEITQTVMRVSLVSPKQLCIQQ